MKTRKPYVFINVLAICVLGSFLGCQAESDNGTTYNSSGDGLPALTGTVIITGTAKVGEILTANTVALNGSGTFSYQWKSGTTNIGTNSNIYTVQTADAGSTITVTVTCSAHSGSVTSASIQIPVLPTSIDITVSNPAEWNAALDTIKNGGNGTTANPKLYTITVNGDIMVNGSTANTFGSAYYVEVTINGNGKLYIIGQGSLLNIRTYQTVCIDSADLILQGLKKGQNDSSQDNNRAIVYVFGGTLELRNGTISDNSSGNTISAGGGVYNGGSFTMSGGTISNNSGGSHGGGVYNGGSFTMSGGNISNNTTTNSLVSNGSSYGGGVYNGGSFTMSGGIISNNSCGSDPKASGTGSDYAAITYGLGGGVYVGGSSSSFNMTGGTISDNSARGGYLIYHISSGTNNLYTSQSSYYYVGGGGVYIEGSISGTSFTKSGGGNISGNDVTVGNMNQVINGKEVFLNASPARYRNTPLGETDDISTNTQTGWNQ